MIPASAAFLLGVRFRARKGPALVEAAVRDRIELHRAMRFSCAAADIPVPSRTPAPREAFIIAQSGAKRKQTLDLRIRQREYAAATGSCIPLTVAL